MTSLGFRKNDYKNPISDVDDSEGEIDDIEAVIPLSDVTYFQDRLWDIWQDLISKTDDLGVPIFDKGTFADFIMFITDNNPYFE